MIIYRNAECNPVPGQVSEHFNLVDRLHTDVLEERYGKISIQLLHHDSSYRAIHLQDSHSISRTFAITLFPEAGHRSDISIVNQAIRAGGAIGKSFREHGYSIRKNVLSIDVLELSQPLRDAFLTDEIHAKARYSEFLVRRGQQLPQVYGIVVEIYHPDFRLPEVNEVDRLQVAPTVGSLCAQGVSLDEAWARLNSEVPYGTANTRYYRAFEASQREVRCAEERIKTILRDRKSSVYKH
jgi:hypothetical protein